MKIDITENDLFLMLSAATRYSVGRRSYIVGSCCEWLEKYTPKLTKVDQGKILYTLEQEFNEQYNDMVLMDQKRWQECANKLRKHYEST